jgi:hypothetical protein
MGTDLQHDVRVVLSRDDIDRCQVVQVFGEAGRDGSVIA